MDALWVEPMGEVERVHMEMWETIGWKCVDLLRQNHTGRRGMLFDALASSRGSLNGNLLRCFRTESGQRQAFAKTDDGWLGSVETKCERSDDLN